MTYGDETDDLPGGVRRKQLFDQLGSDEPAADPWEDAAAGGTRPRNPDGTPVTDTSVTPVAGAATPTPAASTTRDQALQQVQGVYSQYGRTMDPVEDMKDFEGWWGQSKEGGQYQGAGYSRPWTDQLRDFSTRINERFAPEFNTGGGGSTAPQGAQAYTTGSSGGSATGLDSGALGALQSLLSQLQGERTSQAAERTSLRQILMDQLGSLSQPVSRDAPGIREVLAGQRVGLQRGEERARGQAAESRAYEGYGANSDQLRADVERIGGNRAEMEGQMTGQVLQGELQQRRQALNSLLSQALAVGDSESARNIQAQLATIGQQLNQSNFYDRLGFDYAGMQNGLNSQALMALLSAA